MEDTIIRIEDLSSLNPEELISDLLSKLKERERDVIIRRHGLKGGEREILEGIGKVHSLTRERVRQIESAGLKKIREAKEKEILKKIGELVKELIAAHGGIMEKEHLFDVLTHYGLNGRNETRDKEKESIFRNFYYFLLLKILDGFEEVSKSESFLTHIKLAGGQTDHWEKLVADLKKSVEERGKILATNELFALAEEVANGNGLNEKLNNHSLDLSHFYENKFKADANLLKEKKILYAIFKAARTIDQNVFGHWGLADWPEISPRNLNEKIYLVLKNEGQPMHFADIAKRIDKMDFDQKKTNIASAHNELILDDKFVLVGRGMYGLNEWGLKQGTVAEIIAEIIKSAGPLTREEIIEKVLKERMVKKTTIALALANKNKFAKNGDTYVIKEVVEVIDNA